MSRLIHVLLLRRLAARDRRAVLIGLAVLAPVLLYSAAVRPYRAALGTVREQIEVERALLQREEALLAAAPRMTDLATSVGSRAEQAALRLVRAPNLPLAEAEVTGMLESVAAMSRVLLQEMRGVEARRGRSDEPTGRLRPLRLAVRGESDLEGVLTFLQRIEQSPLLLRVVELSIEPAYEGNSRSGDRRATGVIQFALVVEAYVPAEETAS
jgi:hypothetical protein